MGIMDIFCFILILTYEQMKTKIRLSIFQF